MRTARLTALSAGLAVLVLVPSALASPPHSAPPQPVSPGGTGVALVEARCPTFSWAPSRPGKGYELAVYSVPVDGEPSAEPVLSVRLPAGARTWTPSSEQCLARGDRYAWSLRELGRKGDLERGWSEPMLFEVMAAPTIEEVEAALATLRRYRDSGARDPGAIRAPRADAAPAGHRPTPPEQRALPSFAGATGSTLAPKAAPTLGQASLTLSHHLALAAGSGIFQGGTVLLWADATTHNTALGRAALSDPALTGTRNTAVGNDALKASEAGGYNTAVGHGAMSLNVSGTLSTAVGVYALGQATSGSENVAVGPYAGYNVSGGFANIFIGNDGVAGDTQITRIGDVQTKAYVAGIHGASLGGNTVKKVCVDETDQLGPCPPAPPPASALETRGPGAAVLPGEEGRPGGARRELLPEVVLDELQALRRKLEEQQRRLDALEKATTGSGSTP